jgi:hypothetical protein
MSTSRQHADRFAELLDHAESGRRPHRRSDMESELVSLADFAMSMRVMPAPAPSDDLRAGLRAMLLAKIEREGIGATADQKATEAAARAASRSALAGKTQVIRRVPTHGGGRARAAILIGIAAGVLASGVSLASTDSVPGDALYSVKRTSEQAQLVLAGSDASRGRLHLEFAKSRLVELRHVDENAVAGVLATMDADTRSGVQLLFIAATQPGNGSSIDAVMAFVSQQRTGLTELRLGTPAARASLDLLRDVETRANLLRAALLSGCSMDKIDELGPRPAC